MRFESVGDRWVLRQIPGCSGPVVAEPGFEHVDELSIGKCLPINSKHGFPHRRVNLMDWPSQFVLRKSKGLARKYSNPLAAPGGTAGRVLSHASRRLLLSREYS